ncbi:MAG: DedA family protein [Saccharolobus sp.]
MINYVPSNYLILFILMLLEGMSLPIPSEVVMPLAGYLSYQGDMNLYVAVIIGTLGSLIGSIIDYFIAYKLGLPFLKKYGKYIKITESRLDSLNKFFSKYGNVSVFLARFLPAIRALISFPAGLARMSIIYFVLVTFSGHLIWNTVLAFIGYYFGSTWQLIVSSLIKYDYIILALVIIFFTIFILFKHNFLKFKQ